MSQHGSTHCSGSHIKEYNLACDGGVDSRLSGDGVTDIKISHFGALYLELLANFEDIDLRWQTDVDKVLLDVSTIMNRKLLS